MAGPIGPRGLTLLVIVGLIGLALAVIGWTQRYNGLVAPGVGGLVVVVNLRGQIVP